MKPLHRYTFAGAMLSVTMFFFLYTVPFLRQFQNANQLQDHGDTITEVATAQHATKARLNGRNAENDRQQEHSVKSHTVAYTGNAFVVKHQQRGGISTRKTSRTISWILQPRATCDTTTMLVILVCSAVHRFDLRDAIRATWGAAAQKRRHSVRLVFVLGKPEARYSHLEEKIANESRVYGDVLQSDIVDSYANLSLKTRGALAWTATACGATYFVAKTDDDVYVNVRDLLQELTRMRRNGATRFMMGRLIRDAKPDGDRKSKWYTPRAIYANRTYPPYLSGSAYVMSTDLVDGLLGAATRRKLFWLEDIYVTGLLARDVGTQLIDNARFAYTKVPLSDPCRYTSLFAAHELTPTELRTLWSQLHRPDSTCGGSSKEHFRASFAFR